MIPYVDQCLPTILLQLWRPKPNLFHNSLMTMPSSRLQRQIIFVLCLALPRCIHIPQIHKRMQSFY
jgi:hypothetical protein